jgi:hypothetical protein
MIIDTHCHVYASEMENAEEIIRKSMENDIHLILNGTDLKSNAEVLELAEKYDNVHAALGYFYTLAGDITEDDISLLDSQLDDGNVVVFGVALPTVIEGVDLHAVAAAAVKAQSLAVGTGLAALGIEGHADAVSTAVAVVVVAVAGVIVQLQGEVVVASNLAEPKRASLPGLILGEDIPAVGVIVVGIALQGDVALAHCLGGKDQEGQEHNEGEKQGTCTFFHRSTPLLFL